MMSIFVKLLILIPIGAFENSETAARLRFARHAAAHFLFSERMNTFFLGFVLSLPSANETVLLRSPASLCFSMYRSRGLPNCAFARWLRNVPLDATRNQRGDRAFWRKEGPPGNLT